MADPSDLYQHGGHLRDSTNSTTAVHGGKGRIARLENPALICAGFGAAVVLVGGILVLRSVGRQPTARERVERVVPLGASSRRRAGLSRGARPIQLSVGDRSRGNDPKRQTWKSSSVRIGETLATAIATALVGTLMSRLLRGVRKGAVESVEHALNES